MHDFSEEEYHVEELLSMPVHIYLARKIQYKHYLEQKCVTQVVWQVYPWWEEDGHMWL